MPRFLHPLLLMISHFTNKGLACVVEYLLAENRILRSKPPKRIEVTLAEQAKLVKSGKPLAPNPNETWMCQQAWNLSMFFDEQEENKPTHIIRDRDTK